MGDVGEHPDGVPAPLLRSADTLDAANDRAELAARARPSHREPESIGPHRILEKLGEGGMGVVYRAEQREPVRRLVALKVIKLGMDTKEVVARFEAERQALAMMNHPNVAKVFDAGVTEQGRPYFAMEFIAGVPLTQYCDEAKLTTRQRLELFVQVCHAVQHAHQKGIIHRDLKPTNILVTMFDGQPVPKVIDFGIAKATNAALTQHTLYTRTGTMIGTPEYMSPEQAATGGLDVDTRADVYSLGVVLYELLTGRLPFDPETLRAAGPEGFARIIKEAEPGRPSTRLGESRRTRARHPAATGGGGEPAGDDATRVAKCRRTDARSLLKEVRGDLDWIVLKAIEKDRMRRFETANALAMDVQRHLHDEPVLARPPSTAYRLRKLAKRYRAAVVTMLLITASLVAAVVGTGVGLVRARAAEHRANAEGDAAKAARAAAERDARRAVAANHFMRKMFASARPDAQAGGEQVRVTDVLDHAAAGLGRLTDQPELELDGRLTLAETYASLGQYAKAVENYNRVLALSRQLWGAESEQALQATADVVFQMSKAGQGAAAEPVARQAVDVARRTLHERHPVTLDLLNSLGLAVLDAGKHAEAEAEFRGLVAGVREDGQAPGTKGSARFFNNLAMAVAAQGRNAEAEQLQREGIARAQAEPPSDSQRAGSLLADLAATLLQQNRVAEAQAAYGEALSYARRTLGANHPDTLEAMVRVASLHEQRGNNAAALPLRRELLALARAGKREAAAIDAQLLVAQLLAETGQAAAAREAFDAALADQRKSHAPRPELARQTWATANVVLGMGAGDAWAGTALRAFATRLGYKVLAAHAYGNQTLDEVKWDALSFRLDAWPPPTPPPIPGPGKATVPAGDAVLAGGLSELQTAADPPPGIYLMSLSIPRRQGRTLREAMWVYLAPWQLSLHPPGTGADAWEEDRWQAFFDGDPLERRSEPALAFDRVGVLDRGFGPSGRADGFAVAATTRLTVPAGRYVLSLLTDGHGRMFLGPWKHDYTVPDAWPTDVELFEVTEEQSGIDLKILAPAMSRRLAVTLRPQGEDADRMMRAARGTASIDAEPERLAEQIAAEGPRARTLADRARALARIGDFEDAAALYATAIELQPDDHGWQYEYVCVLAWLGRTDAYRELCSAMIHRLGDAPTHALAERTAKACLLLPGVADDPVTMARLADGALTGAGAGHTYLPYFQMCKGFAEYRASRYAEALAKLEQAQPGVGANDWGPAIPATCHMLRAMTLLKLDRPADARVAMGEADEALRNEFFEPGFDDFGPNLADELICDVIRREARAMLPEEPKSDGGKPAR